MDERIISIVENDLRNDYLKYESELQRIINSDEDINDKVGKIKKILHNMSVCTTSTSIWTNLVGNMETEQIQENKKEEKSDSDAGTDQ